MSDELLGGDEMLPSDGMPAAAASDVLVDLEQGPEADYFTRTEDDAAADADEDASGFNVVPDGAEADSAAGEAEGDGEGEQPASEAEPYCGHCPGLVHCSDYIDSATTMPGTVDCDERQQLDSVTDGMRASKISADLQGQKVGDEVDNPLYDDRSAEYSAEARPTSYAMNHAHRGRLIIIDNINFDAITQAPPRIGSDKDSARLKRVFEGLGFEVKVKKNLTAAGMNQLMVDETGEKAEEYLRNSDCFAVAVLTHGSEHDVLYGVDATTTIDEFRAPIKNCKALFGKPKLFFFQACRGEQLIGGVETAGVVDDDVVEACVPRPTCRIPREADFLYAFSTPPKCFAWRNQLNGSWFIQSLCNQLEKHAKTLDLVHILTRVNDQVAYEYESKCPNHPHLNEMKQIPSIVSMLTKDLYFYERSDPVD